MTAPDTGRALVDHARTELERLGEYEHEPAFAAAITAAVAAFASYGHSGFSAMHGREVLCGLLNRENLTPLTSDPGEWVDRTAISNLPAGEVLWQNTRNPAAFSEDRGVTYWLTTDIRDTQIAEHGIADPEVDHTAARIFYPTIDPPRHPASRQDPNPHLAPVGTFDCCSRDHQPRCKCPQPQETTS